jgi:raffinose/stachyose/melibiose transport system permease protein
VKLLGRPALVISVTLAVVWALPLVSLLGKSFAGEGAGNYAAVIQQGGIGQSLLNSAFITLTTVFGVVAITALAGFAFSQLRFPLRNVSYGILLTGLMLPAGAILVPFSQLNRAFGWGDTYAAVIFPYVALFFPLGLLLLKNAFDSLPEEIFEAAAIDGSSLWRMFWSIGLPLAAPAVSLVALWTFLSTWNEFLLALLFLHDPSVQPVSIIPLRFQQQYFVDVPKIFAALVLSQLPVVVLYIVTQKRFTLGLLAGTGK